jgi:hypothetical protein
MMAGKPGVYRFVDMTVYRRTAIHGSHPFGMLNVVRTEQFAVISARRSRVAIWAGFHGGPFDVWLP